MCSTDLYSKKLIASTNLEVRSQPQEINQSFNAGVNLWGDNLLWQKSLNANGPQNQWNADGFEANFRYQYRAWNGFKAWSVSATLPGFTIFDGLEMGDITLSEYTEFTIMSLQCIMRYRQNCHRSPSMASCFRVLS